MEYLLAQVENEFRLTLWLILAVWLPCCFLRTTSAPVLKYDFPFAIQCAPMYDGVLVDDTGTRFISITNDQRVSTDRIKEWNPLVRNEKQIEQQSSSLFNDYIRR